MGDEKIEEKEVQRREEKFNEKWRRDPVSSIVGAAILMWAGVVLLSSNMGYLDTFTELLAGLSIRPYDIPLEGIPFIDSISLGAWQVFFLGMAVIVLVEIVVRLLIPAYRRRVLGSFIGAILLFALGLGNWTIVGPSILIAIGLSLLFNRARGRG